MPDGSRAPLARWLSQDMAAAYLCLSLSTFRRRVKDKTLPAAVETLGVLRWDREALDVAMGGRTMAPTASEAADATADEIRAQAQGRAKAPRGRHDPGIHLRARA